MTYFQPDRELANMYTLRGGFMVRAAILLSAALFAGAAQADEQCTLRQLGSFELKQLSDGMLSIPITIAGKPQIMEVAISSPFSYLYADYGDAENFPKKKLPSNIAIHINGQDPKKTYTIPTLLIGNAAAKDIEMVRVEGPRQSKGEAVGQIALDLLANFDVEFDMKNEKMNLFAQDHCDGQVVYWAKSYATLPFKTDASGHTNFKMSLDGKDVTVAFDISPRPGIMGMKTANRIFDLDENSPGVARVENTRKDGPSIYRYPFKSLSIEGVTITNPKIFLYQQSTECRTNLRISENTRFYRCFGASDLHLGLAEICQLHLYFAFKEKKLYVTAADAH